MFFTRPFFGVGPDNFGYYYDQHRSLYSFKSAEFLATNDAHSAVIQSMATLGIFAMLAFTFLLLILIRSLYINYNKYPNHRPTFYWLGVFFLLFITNSNISPITLPHKYLFWALAGFSIGAAYSNGVISGVRKVIAIPIRAGVASVTALAIFIAGNFVYAQIKFDLGLAKIANQSIPNYQFSSYLPCLIYFGPQSGLMTDKKDDKVAMAITKKNAKKALELNPRCLEAKMNLTRIAFQETDIPNAKKLVYELLEQAPARRDVISLASIYALTQNDFSLQKKLISQGRKLDLLDKKQ
jgi:hypothetical protein